MKKNNILWGVALIAFAIGIVLSELKIIVFDIKLIFAIFLVFISVKALIKKQFFFSTGLLGIIVLLNPNNLFPNFSFWTVLLIVALLSIGLNLIFKDQYKARIYYNSKYKTKDTREDVNGDSLDFKAVFNQATKYVYADDLSNLELSAVFGNLNVYLDQATINPSALINLECVFAKTEIFVPSGYRINYNSVTTVFSTINEINPPATYHTTIRLDGEVVFGILNIIYL